MRLFAALALAAALLVPSAVAAQTVCPTTDPALGTVPANVPIRLAWDYPSTALPGIGFSVLVDGAIVKNFAAADLTVAVTTGFPSCSTISGAIAGLPARTTPYRVKLRAYVGTDSTAPGFVETAEKNLTVGVTVPFNFRIVLTPVTSQVANKVVGVDVEYRSADGSVIKEFVPVAAFTGRLDLATTTVIQREE